MSKFPFNFRFILIPCALVILCCSCGLDSGLNSRVLDNFDLEFEIDRETHLYSFNSTSYEFGNTDKNVFIRDTNFVKAIENIRIYASADKDSVFLNVELIYEFDTVDIKMVHYGDLFGTDWEPKSGVNKKDLYQESLTGLRINVGRYALKIDDAEVASKAVTFMDNDDNDVFDVLLDFSISDLLLIYSNFNIPVGECDLKELSFTIGLE